ncbi:hypothetical protein HK096_010335, partial [Nowakowskiella sp. JEL0078]
MNTSTNYKVPTRAILTTEDLARFQTSDAYNDLLGFISRLNESVRNKTLRADVESSDVVNRLLNMLD